MKKLLALAAALLLTGCTSTAQITETSDYYEIDVKYPVTSNSQVNLDIKTMIDSFITNFKGEIEPITHGDGTMKNGLWISYTEYPFAPDSPVTTYLFQLSLFTGGAHPNTTLGSYTYNLDTGKLYELDDLFKANEDYLTPLSELVKADLRAQDEIVGAESASWLEDGAAPTPDNYQTFVIDQENLTFYFPPYQVAPYAAGIREVSIPLPVLSGFLDLPFASTK